MSLKSTILLLTTLCIVAQSVLAIRGVDMSLVQCQTATASSWQCLKNSGFDFGMFSPFHFLTPTAIIEVWNGGYQYNEKIRECVGNARAAGFKYIDLYAFMCPNCRNNYPAANAIDTMLSKLNEQSVEYGQLWLDIEQCNGCWFDQLSQNAHYVKNASAAAEEFFSREGKGHKVGIYSSVYEWSQTVGSSTNGLSNLQLWYAHYDDTPSFSDSWAYTFGGWTKPAIKQYYDHGPASCGVDVDVNFY